jgi:anti-sigma regulatory factor (Ser/Thr protein kinase)
VVAAERTVGPWATTAGLDPYSIEDLQLAVGEAAGNAVEHAYGDASTPGRVQVEMDFDDDGTLGVSVSDTGTWRPEPADPGHRGRGLQIISALGRDVAEDAGPSGTSSGSASFRRPVPRPVRGRRPLSCHRTRSPPPY